MTVLPMTSVNRRTDGYIPGGQRPDLVRANGGHGHVHRCPSPEDVSSDEPGANACITRQE